MFLKDEDSLIKTTGDEKPPLESPNERHRTLSNRSPIPGAPCELHLANSERERTINQNPETKAFVMRAAPDYAATRNLLFIKFMVGIHS